MKLYATTTSERGKPVNKSGNIYLNIDININSKEPSYRLRIIDDELLGIAYISLEFFSFGKWHTLFTTEKDYMGYELVKKGIEKHSV